MKNGKIKILIEERKSTKVGLNIDKVLILQPICLMQKNIIYFALFRHNNRMESNIEYKRKNVSQIRIGNIGKQIMQSVDIMQNRCLTVNLKKKIMKKCLKTFFSVLQTYTQSSQINSDQRFLIKESIFPSQYFYFVDLLSFYFFFFWSRERTTFGHYLNFLS